MKFVVVVLFSLIGSASAAVSQADCATLSAYMRCHGCLTSGPPRPIVTPPFVNGAGVLAPQAMQPRPQRRALGQQDQDGLPLKRKNSLCARPTPIVVFLRPTCKPSASQRARPQPLASAQTTMVPVPRTDLFVQSDDCISSGFMTNDYKVSGASSIMASTVILAFIAAGLATFA